jgi:hypothetical protein
MTSAATLRNSRAMEKGSDDQENGVKQTLLFWQRRTSKKLSVEDARQMSESVAGFFSQLDAWDAAETANVTDISPVAVNKPMNRRIENAA